MGRGVNSLLCFLDWLGVGIQLVFIECITGCLNRWSRGRCPIRILKVHCSWKNAMLWLFILFPNVWFALWPIESGPVCACVFFQAVKLFVNASEEYGEHHYHKMPTLLKVKRYDWGKEDMRTFNNQIRSSHQVYRRLKSQESFHFQKLSFANCVLTFEHTAVILMIKITWRIKFN